MVDLSWLYVAAASGGLGLVVLFLIRLAQSHESAKRRDPLRLASEYKGMAVIGIGTTGLAGLLALLGIVAGLGVILWSASALMGLGVMLVLYAGLGYQDAVSKRTATHKPRGREKAKNLAGTLALVCGVAAFLSWGLDVIALPLAALAVAIAAVWVILQISDASRNVQR